MRRGAAPDRPSAAAFPAVHAGSGRSIRTRRLERLCLSMARAVLASTRKRKTRGSRDKSRGRIEVLDDQNQRRGDSRSSCALSADAPQQGRSQLRSSGKNGVGNTASQPEGLRAPRIGRSEYPVNVRRDVMSPRGPASNAACARIRQCPGYSRSGTTTYGLARSAPSACRSWAS